MRILFLAPHPFFQNRGTPIDVLLVLRVLAERSNTFVDLVTYNEGEDVGLRNVRIFRTPNLKILQKVRPGFSFKKLLCDFFMFFKAWSLIRKNGYELIHADEECVFFAMFFKLLYGTPYVYDLDSSIAQQLVEQKRILAKLAPLFDWMESQAIRHSLVTFPVCNALAALCETSGSNKTVTLHDISQLKNPCANPTGKLKQEIGAEGLILLYCGNLEKYQGIDLLLDSFGLVYQDVKDIHLVIIGGVKEDIEHYEDMSRRLGIDKRTHFIGPRPFDQLDQYLAEADIVACPRIKGVNTPMKIFPYLHSGKPVLATDLVTHNQLLSKNEAYLAKANPVDFAKGMKELAENKKLRKRLGQKGRAFVEKDHTYEAHQRRLHGAYDWIERQIFGRSSYVTAIEPKSQFKVP
jgi:glycosyltransferase involved in cell wall biosynthesis